MGIQNHSAVSMNYVLTLDSGDLADKSDEGEPLEFIFGEGQIVPGLEKALDGAEVGAKISCVIEPEEAYGESNPTLVRAIPRDQFPEDVKLEEGMVFMAEGAGHPVMFLVQGVTDEEVQADFNHPLAGQRLHFEVEIVGVRDATEEEIAALSQGGCCGHDHSHDGCGGCHEEPE